LRRFRNLIFFPPYVPHTDKFAAGADGGGR